MGQQIIQQPNGRYCIYSSIVDNVTYYDLDRDELVEALLERSRKSIQHRVDVVLEKLRTGGKPYHQFTMTYLEMLESIAEQHGESNVIEAIRRIEKAQRDREGTHDAGN